MAVPSTERRDLTVVIGHFGVTRAQQATAHGSISAEICANSLRIHLEKLIGEIFARSFAGRAMATRV
jgi:hypothetical protein